MKKFIFSVLITLFMVLPNNVLAEGYVSVTTTELTIEKGSSKTFTITAYNAIGDVTIKSNAENIAKTNSSQWETGAVGEKETKTTEITVTGVNVGTTTITINIDAATFDEEDLSGQTKTITVTVKEKEQKPDEPDNPDVPDTPNQPDTPDEPDNPEDNPDDDEDDDKTYKLKLNFDKDTTVYINGLSFKSSPHITDFKENEKYDLSDYIAKKHGYTFKGWDTSNNCNSPSKTGEYKITSDTSLYACFQIDEAVNPENNDVNQNVTENPKTGNYGMIIILIITTFIAIIFSNIYYNKIKKLTK